VVRDLVQLGVAWAAEVAFRCCGELRAGCRRVVFGERAEVIVGCARDSSFCADLADATSGHEEHDCCGADGRECDESLCVRCLPPSCPG
jgi:hypothetical protein